MRYGISMRTLLVATLGVFALSCGGGGGAVTGIPEAEACAQASKAACTKLYACSGGTFVTIQAVLGTEADCETTVLQNCGSTGFVCVAGQTYHGDQAQSCKDQFSGQSCDALDAEITTGLTASGTISTSAVIASVTASAPACAQICTTASGGGADAGADVGVDASGN
jgi:hypothetical protein